jgi:hypothetical protein
MSKISEKEWVEDFQEFVRSAGAPVPNEVSNSILSRVRQDLNPSAWLVFAKLLTIHSVVGTLSLAICNQFGISPFQTGFSLSDYFMKFGHSTCMVLCGVLFVSLSVLLTRVIIRPEEFHVLRRNAWLEIFALSMISLGMFAVLGAEITLAVGVLWLTGALLGGVAMALFPKPLRLAQ